MITKAKESPQVIKARKKIQQHMDAAEKKMGPNELKKTRFLIERQLDRHQTERINLKAKNVTLFDENAHPAQTESKFVARLMRQLKKPDNAPKTKNLEGRVRAISDDE